ncbi:hypothetical protein [Nocardia sp. NPDC050793]|uniref:hypothetical protein n=1 Tax=Nocardia sp. NPDC050793 TaxID=3155159 RepID=UPI0033FEACC9
MSDTRDIAARLAALPDAELVPVLRAAVEGRSALWAVRAALDELAGAAHATPGSDVSPATSDASAYDGGEGAAASGQVGGSFPVPAVPVQPTGIPTMPETGGYSPSGVPTFESVRDKVERRFGTAQGIGELDRQTPAGRSADERFAAREKAARERLDRIRKSLRGEGAD